MKRFRVLMLVLLLGIQLMACQQNAKPKQFNITYYYEEPCANCESEKEVLERLEKQLRAYVSPSRYVLKSVNSFQQAKAYEQEVKRLGLDAANTGPPLLVAGDRYLAGAAAIRKAALAMFGEVLDFEPREVRYYHRPSCPDCVVLEPAVEENFPLYPELAIISIDTTEKEPKEAFKALLAEKKVPEDLWQIPFIISGDNWISCPDLDAEALVDFLAKELASLPPVEEDMNAD